jgi:ribosomal protein S18 acetylase RimI-like enzyme
LLFKKEQKEYDITLNTERTYSEKWTDYFSHAITNEDDCVVVAEETESHACIGYLCGIPKKKNPCRTLDAIVELDNMFVSDVYRSQGIGWALVEKFKERAKTKWIQRIRVSVSAQNKKALSFYSKHGLVQYDEILEMDI